MKKIRLAIIFIIIAVGATIIMNLFYQKQIVGRQYFSEKDLKLPNGYVASLSIRGLKNPSCFTMDKENNIYIGENINGEGRIVKYKPDGKYNIEVRGLSSPVKGMVINRGKIYISHRGKISVYFSGILKDIISGLPSYGDYSNNGISIGYDGRIYICQGSATNAGVVGMDNFERGWLSKYPYFHDYSSQDIILSGTNFKTKNPLTKGGYDNAYTGTFLPFNSRCKLGDVVKGMVPSSASIMRINPDGSELETFVYGIRNPQNVLTLPDGRMIVGNQGMENRGSRPIENGCDNIYFTKKNEWLGWPEYENGEPVTLRKFKSKDSMQPEFMTEMHPKGEIQKPIFSFKECGRIGMMDYCRKSDFSGIGEIFVPFSKGRTEKACICVLNLKNKTKKIFAENSDGGNYLEKPFQCTFTHDGKLMVLEGGKGSLIKIERDYSKVHKLFPEFIPTQYLLGIIVICFIVYMVFALRRK